MAGNPIDVYNHGKMERDFTYVDDIVEGIIRAIYHPATPNDQWNGNHPDPSASYAPYRLYNIGNSCPTPLMEYIETLEAKLGKKAIYNMMPMQAGDVPSTSADTSRLQSDLGYKPSTTVQEGVGKFVEWYIQYYVEPTSKNAE